MATTKFNKKASPEKFDKINIGPLFIGIRRAAEVLGISPSTLRNWAKKGIIDSEYRYSDGHVAPHAGSCLRTTGMPAVVKGPHMARAYQCISMSNLGQIVRGEEVRIYGKVA